MRPTMSLNVAVPTIVSLPQTSSVEALMVQVSAFVISVVPRARPPGAR